MARATETDRLVGAMIKHEEADALAELARTNERSLSAELRLAIRNWLAMHRAATERSPT